jgi:heme/copper-type cytochrome/quinol oxidase subunit 2
MMLPELVIVPAEPYEAMPPRSLLPLGFAISPELVIAPKPFGANTTLLPFVNDIAPEEVTIRVPVLVRVTRLFVLVLIVVVVMAAPLRRRNRYEAAPARPGHARHDVPENSNTPKR